MKLASLIFFVSNGLWAAEHMIPLAGNAYIIESPTKHLDVYFWIDKKAEIKVDLAPVTGLSKKIELVLNDKVKIAGPTAKYSCESGYQKVTIVADSVNIESIFDRGILKVASENSRLILKFVPDNTNDQYYWGRRGPSAHFWFEMPQVEHIDAIYNEITVEKGKDPLGSYFMANGFSMGYFGIQVNSNSERRVLFSIWSSYNTDDPKKIPDDLKPRIVELGPAVKSGSFGGEGSGAQTYLVFPWTSQKTYKFLTRVSKGTNDSAIFTSWFFAPEDNKWRLIASIESPKTEAKLTGFYSFIENFYDYKGNEERMAIYGPAWALSQTGQWYQLNVATLTGDSTAILGNRLDVEGGTKNGLFYLRQGGYFNASIKLNTKFKGEIFAEKPSLPQ